VAEARSKTRGFWLAVILVAVSTALGVTGPANAGPGKSRQVARVVTPDAWRAYPLNHVRPENADEQAATDACDFEARQRRGTRALLVFLVGRVNFRNGAFGVGSDSEFKPNRVVHDILMEAAHAYDRCRGSARKKVRIAYGVTNYELSRELSTHRQASRAGRAQYRLARRLEREYPAGIQSALAADLEPGWDPRGSGYAVALARGGTRGRLPYFNIGTAGHCPPYGAGCQGNWTLADIGRVSQNDRIIPLPEIYYPRQARSWNRVAKAWDSRHCRRKSGRGCYEFGGVTSAPVGCNGVAFTQRQAWLRMRRITRNPVGRRIIYYNPRRVGC
jgi:hypothetical protein